MRSTIVPGLVAISLVLATAAIAQPQKPPVNLGPHPTPTVGGLPKSALSASGLAAIRAYKPLTPQQKKDLVVAAHLGSAQPAPEGPFTLSPASMVRVVPGGQWATFNFFGPYQVSGGGWENTVAFASFGAPHSSATLSFNVTGQKAYLVDCAISGADTVTFDVWANFAHLGQSAATPIANHTTYVLPKSGTPQDVGIGITASVASGAAAWELFSCEVTPFQ